MTKIGRSAKQLIFNLNSDGVSSLENFYISRSNQLAVSSIKNWAKWPEKKFLLTGPTGSGKSHLAEIWVESTKAKRITRDNFMKLNVVKLPIYKALLIDDVDRIFSDDLSDSDVLEENLLHLLNSVTQSECYIMMTSIDRAPFWNIKLPDLVSRLKSIAVVDLRPPDDELLVAVLLKQFDDRQIKVSPEFVAFVAKRIDRSFEAVSEFVNSIDHFTLKQKRNVTIPVASEVLKFLQNDRSGGSSKDNFDSSTRRSDYFG